MNSRGVVAHLIDFGASTSGFKARWALGSNIPSARRPGQRFHFLQCMGSSPSLCFVNRHGGTLRRAGWVAFTKTYSRGKWLISHLPPTFAIITHIPLPVCPCIWRPRVPVAYVPASHAWCSQVPRFASPSPKSPNMRPDVPVPLSPSHFYTKPKPTEVKNQRKWTLALLTIEGSQ